MSDPNEKKGLFVAVGHARQRLWSSDGETWSEPQIEKTGEILRAVCYANGHFVTIGFCGGMNFFGGSSDGKDWKTQAVPNQYIWFVRDVAFGDGKFLAVGGEEAFIQTTDDGLTWSERTVFKEGWLVRPNVKPFDNMSSHCFMRLTYGKDRFVALGQHGWRGTSKDGKNWQTAEDNRNNDAIIDIVWGNGVFVGAGLNGLRMTSADGLKWTNRVVGEEGEHINTILWTGDRFVGIGAGATYLSPDGYKWERRPNQNAPLRAAYGNGVFVGCHWKGRLFHSNDAVTWKQVKKCENHIEALAFGG